MKKIILSIMMICFLAILSGCAKKNIVLIPEEIHTETILVKADGTVQGATVEEFNKTYYNITELDGFITKEIEKYNNSATSDAIIKDTLVLSGENAVLILNYSNLEHFNEFNGASSSLYSTGDLRESTMKLPESYLSAKDGSIVTKEVALKNNDYKVLIIKANSDILVNGEVKYYDNAVLVNKSKVQTGTKGESVIIFKPYK